MYAGSLRIPPLAVTVIGILLCTAGLTVTSHAAESMPLNGDAINFSTDDAFYLPPPQLPEEPGTLLRTKPAPHIANLLGPDFPGHAQVMLYSSTDEFGSPVAVSGYVIEPTNQWHGLGPTPTVVFGPGTRGQGDICAPSRSPLLLGASSPTTPGVSINYELLVQYAAASLGMRVVVTDYIGLGTPGIHTYINATEEAHAVLDAARAGLHAVGAPADSPLGFHGYSQGGGAVASAVEHARAYAPDLNIKGTYSGAPPADLLEVFNSIDGSGISPVLAMAINGFSERNPKFKAAVDRHISAEGREYLGIMSHRCIADASLTAAFSSSEKLLVDGATFDGVLAQEPDIVATLERQRLGQQAPTSPILISSALFDDLIPFDQAKQLAKDYCQLGANVTFSEELTPPMTPDLKTGVNHGIQSLIDIPGSLKYLQDRFNEVPTVGNCADIS